LKSRGGALDWIDERNWLNFGLVDNFDADRWANPRRHWIDSPRRRHEERNDHQTRGKTLHFSNPRCYATPLVSPSIDPNDLVSLGKQERE
jgi:hypothetical protein